MPAAKKDIINFSIIMVVFTIGMVIMLIYDVSVWWIWYIYFAVWTIAEVKIAKNMHLKWWHWALIITGILLLDVLIVELVG